MKIVEALKRLRVIEKKMDSNNKKIEEYASSTTGDRLPFGTEENQKTEVSARVQRNTDLMTEYMKLKKQIEKTNLEEEVEIDGKMYSLSDLLVIKRKMAQEMLKTYRSLNENNGRDRIRHAQSIDGQKAAIITFYDEAAKNTSLEKWQDLYDNIDARLEVLNATRELREL